MRSRRQATSRVRIIAGEFKGFLVETPSVNMAHVMGERERAAIFNALFSLGGVEGARVLDMFAGSGALGFEALSRGAASCDFVENNAKTREIIAKNAANLPKQALWPASDEATRALASLSAEADSPHIVISRHKSLLGLPTDNRYDVIFSDAPYDEPQWELVGELPKMLDEGGKLVASHAKEEQIPEIAVAGLANVYSKVFAGAQVDIFVK